MEQTKLNFSQEVVVYTDGEKALIRSICERVRKGRELMGEEPELYRKIRESIAAKMRRADKDGSIKFSPEEKDVIEAEREYSREDSFQPQRRAAN